MGNQSKTEGTFSLWGKSIGLLIHDQMVFKVDRINCLEIWGLFQSDPFSLLQKSVLECLYTWSVRAIPLYPISEKICISNALVTNEEHLMFGKDTFFSPASRSYEVKSEVKRANPKLAAFSVFDMGCPIQRTLQLYLRSNADHHEPHVHSKTDQSFQIRC